MTFLNLNEQFVRFRLQSLIRKLNEEKRCLKRLLEKKTKLINKIAFYEGILEKLQQCQEDVDEKTEFYITILLEVRGRYRSLKKLSELHFTEDEKLHADLQKLLRRVLELDPTLYDHFWEMNSHFIRICPFSTSVDEELSFDSGDTVDLAKDLYRIWIRNLFNSFELLRDYESWRPKNFHNDKLMGCCRAPCTCYIEKVEERMYRIICRNVFFNHYQHRHETPPWSYWSNKAGFFFVI
jgi:hypothetical protein